MKLINNRDRVRGMSDAFNEKHPTPGPELFAIVARLQAVNMETVPAEDVAAIMFDIRKTGWLAGFRWPSDTCVECRKEITGTVIDFDHNDYESVPFRLCLECVSAAMVVMMGADVTDSPSSNPAT